MSTTLPPETRHARGAVLPLHRHQAPYAALVVEGSHLEFGPDGPVLCEPGTLLLHPAFHAHGNRFGQHGARVMNLALDDAQGWPSFAALQVGDMPAAREVFRCGPGALAELLRASPTLPTPAAPDWQPAFVAALAAGDEALGAIARRLGVSLEHAGRRIREAYGMPPQALRRELRWRHALALLRSGEPLAQAAAVAGFADQSHFTRTTRLCAGLTPSALRRRINCVQDAG